MPRLFFLYYAAVNPKLLFHIFRFTFKRVGWANDGTFYSPQLCVFSLCEIYGSTFQVFAICTTCYIFASQNYTVNCLLLFFEYRTTQCKIKPNEYGLVKTKVNPGLSYSKGKPTWNSYMDCGVSLHTCLEAPRGVKKFAKDINPLGPSRGSMWSILGHFWNFAT